MHRLSLLVVATATLFVSLTGAQAQNLRSWVSSTTGNDLNSCARSAPCASFATALSKTQDGGSISCVDSGSYVIPAAGGLTITQGVEIDCRGVDAVVEITGTVGIVINVTSPTTQSVTLRGLLITGRTGTAGKANARGLYIQAARNVNLSHVTIEQFALQGILDARNITVNSNLHLADTTVAGVDGAGIVVAMSPGSGIFANAFLDKVTSNYNLYGVAVGNGNRVRIDRSSFSSNTNGLETDVGGRIAVDNSTLSYHSGGVIVSNGQITLSNSDMSFNTTVFSGGGSIFSYGNNRVNNYTNFGVTPTFVGGTTTDHGQF